jgi:hypothetical protein
MRLSARTGSSRTRPTLLIALAAAFALGAQAAASEDDSFTVPNDEQASSGAAAQTGTPSGEQAAEPAAEQPSPFRWSWDNTVTYGLGFRLQDPDESIIGLAAGGTAFSVNGDDGNQNYPTGIFTNAAKITSEFEFDYKGFGGFVRVFAFYDFENENADRARTPLSDDALDRVGKRAEFRDAFLYYRFNLGSLPGELRAGWQVINWGESTFIQGGINAVNPFDVSALRVPGAELRDALLPVGAVKLSLKPTTSTSLEGFYAFTWEELKLDPVGSYFSTTDLAGAGAEKVMLGFGSAPDTIPVGGPIPGNPIGVAVPRRDPREPSSQGQYGVALRYLAEGLGGTEFGLYFLNYHSRLPLITAQTGTAAGILQTGNYAATASYFLTYPEDIKLLGFSFNTQLGRTGIAMQGEVSHRWDVPLQMDDVELLYAALSPLRLLPPVPQLAPLIGLGRLLAANNQIGAYGFSEEIRGYRNFETTQAQLTLTKAFSRALWADQLVLVGEVGWGTVHDLPDQSELRLEAPGTYTSGNQIFQAAGVQPGTEPASAFPTSNAWGYVVAGRLEYNNAIGAVNMVPRFSFAQDVSGISPGPGGNFIEGRKALTIGLGFQYLFNWEFDVSYTSFFGAGRYNLINDRDFLAANVKYSF